jgi:hypothetical protein
LAKQRREPKRGETDARHAGIGGKPMRQAVGSIIKDGQ